MKNLLESDKQKMEKQIVRWKSVKGIRHQAGDPTVPDIIDEAYRRTLIASILSMEKKAPIHFDEAVRLADKTSREAFFEGRMGTDAHQSFWYFSNFVDWISSLGYHIELTGDEFELISTAQPNDC